jgi:hypothetical protein
MFDMFIFLQGTLSLLLNYKIKKSDKMNYRFFLKLSLILKCINDCNKIIYF